jgi:hypothetical protein
MIRDIFGFLIFWLAIFTLPFTLGIGGSISIYLILAGQRLLNR